MKDDIFLVTNNSTLAENIKEEALSRGFLFSFLSPKEFLEKNTIESNQIVIMDITLNLEELKIAAHFLSIRSSSENSLSLLIANKEQEKEASLNLEGGIDDCILSPFSMGFFFSKIKSWLRRCNSIKRTHKINLGPYVMDLDKLIVKKEDKEIFLTLSEFSILKKLLENKGHVVRRQDLLTQIHNHNDKIIERNVDVHLAAIRKKMDFPGKLIETVRGVGYRLIDNI